jgi:hypothetical protein
LSGLVAEQLEPDIENGKFTYEEKSMTLNMVKEDRQWKLD